MVPTRLRFAKRVVAGTSRLQRINIGPRLSLCFLLIIVAMLAGNAVLLWQFQQSRRQAERLAGVDQELIAVLQAHTSLMSFYERLDVLAHSEDTALLQKQIETLHHALLEESLRTRATLSHVPPEVELDQTLLPTLLAIQGELPAQLETIASLAKSGAWDPVRLRIANQVRPLESRSAALVENVDRVVGEQRAQAILSIRQAEWRIFLIVPLTAVITLVFATFLGLVITRSITQPLGRLVEGSAALAKGDFCHRVPATGEDEIARLGSVFNDMTIRLQEVYRDLQASETYLAEAQRLSQTGSFGWDSASGKIYWSTETFRIFELEPTTRVPVDAILERPHRDDQSPLQEVMERVARDRTALDVEHRLLMPNGSVKHLRVVGHPFTDHGEFLGAVTDITEQKRAQQALAASERNLAAIINTIPTAAWTTRPDGYCDFINQVWFDYTGMTAEQAQGWGWAEAIHPDDRMGLLEYWQSCLASGTPMDTEVRMRRYDGAYRWFLFRANPLRDESGKIVKWYGTNIDIEDRKRGEEALHARELSWRQIVDSIPGLVATTGAMGEVEFLNRQTLEYFGKTNEELKNWALIAAVHPDDLARVLEARKKSIEAGQIYDIEHRCRRADGVFRWFQVRGLPVRDGEGKIIAWYLLLTDIDDRKRAEAQVEQAYLRLAEAQRLSKTGSFIADLLADDHNWSEEAFRIFEFDPAAKVTVQMIRDTIYPEDLPTFEAVIARGMTGADVDFVFRIVTPRGAVKHLRGMARVMAQSGSRPLFIGALQAVTESKLAEEALDKARSELARVARITALNALTASIAHEEIGRAH